MVEEDDALASSKEDDKNNEECTESGHEETVKSDSEQVDSPATLAVQNSSQNTVIREMPM